MNNKKMSNLLTGTGTIFSLLEKEIKMYFHLPSHISINYIWIKDLSVKIRP